MALENRGAFNVMSSNLAEFNAKFRVEELEIAESEHWVWSVRPVHSTLGAGVLSLKRFCESMSDAAPDEVADLATITKVLESRLADTFAPDKMNYLMLMMVDAHLHFHVLPRYSKSVEFGGMNWTDDGWPALPEIGANAELARPDVLFEVRDALRV